MSYTGMSYDDWQDLQKVQKENKPPKKPPKPTKPDKSDKKGDNGDSDSTKNKVQGVIDGASKVLSTLQAANAQAYTDVEAIIKLLPLVSVIGGVGVAGLIAFTAARQTQ